MNPVFEILGCGTSTGVPVPLCDCLVCKSTDLRNNRLRASALVKLPEGKNILIDASTDFRLQAMRANLESIDAVLFTHAHADHYLGIDDLRPYCYSRTSAIPCRANQETCDRLKSIFDYAFFKDPNWKGGKLPELDLETCSPGDKLRLFDKLIDVFELKHGEMQVLGFKFGNIAYATDCNSIPEASRSLLDGIDILVLDAIRYRSHPTHFSIDEAIAVANSLNVGKTYFIHMTHDIDYLEASKKLPAGFEYCYDGLKIEFEW
ncbi:MAG: MBL fold metallo-hydrolase [Bdellovibrionota bacterium]